MNAAEVDEDELLADSSESSSSSSEGGEEEEGGGPDRHEEEDSEEEMEMDEDALQLQLNAINDKLCGEPYSYDLYVEKIGLLKKLGDLFLLREVREKMSVLYPLSPSLWVEWVGDEQKLAATEDEHKYVFSLMERAVRDYSSVEVWLEYVSLCLAHMEDEGGVARCREVYERALGSCGLNVATGSLIWDGYRDFEAALLSTMKTEGELEEQEKRYVSLCNRQLAVPLLDMRQTYEQVKGRIQVDANTENSYRKGLERLKELENWEAKLVETQDEQSKLKVYTDYIEEEKRVKSNPARIQCLYERAITDSPLTVSLWLDYIDYLSKNLKIPDVIMSVAERASRNCPWVLSIWLKYLWVIEAFEPTEMFDKGKTVFESALVYCGTGDQAGTLWLKYLEFLRRRIDLQNPDSKNVEILRKTFGAAESHLVQVIPEPNDFISQILQFQARFEALIANAMTNDVREMWKNIFHRGYGQKFRVWSQYITQEVKYGADAKRIRNELGRAMAQVHDDPQSVADMWLNFERDFGNLTTLSNAEEKIANGLLYSNGYSYDQPKGKKRKFFEEPLPTNIPYKKGRPIDSVDGSFKVPAIPKLKQSFNKTEKKELPKVEPSGPVKHDPSKDDRTVFVSNLDFKADEAALKSFFETSGTVEEIRLVRDFKGRSKGFGYVVFKSHENAAAALSCDRKPLESRPVFVSKCDPDKATRPSQFKYSTSIEKNKLFVKGLPFSMTQDDVKKMFQEFGTIKDCRLVTNRSGSFKGIAYVDFENAGQASAAILKTDGTEMNGSVISVAISHPPSKTAPKSLPFSSTTKSDPSQRRERNVFVPRALQVHPTTAEEKQTTSAKSNDDFRKLFMNK